MKRIAPLAIAAVAALTLVACSSDDKDSIDQIDDLSEITLPDAGDITLPDGVDITLPDGSDISVPNVLTGECGAVYAQLISAMTAAFAPGSEVDLDQVFSQVSANVPDELQGDVEVLSAALRELAEIMQSSGGDMSSPEVAQAIQEMSTPEVSAASDRLNAYFDATCPQG
ncbi:MAG: hypothetical protein Q7V62_15970 [Actinomycetota bacterium]|nr:hypothetical protein [Actinomycetota bacterium]